MVVPHAGTWIEIFSQSSSEYVADVVPHAGTWIEIKSIGSFETTDPVVPHAGTWIEIFLLINALLPIRKSFPMRERGLKS